jgi:hypothetical protein
MNRRRHHNAVPVGAIAKCVVIALFLCVTGLSYCYCKYQMHATGNEIKLLEHQLDDLVTQNDVVHAKTAQLSSRSYLQKRLAEGFIRMAPITDDRIVRVGTLSSRTAALSDGLRPVANHLTK